MARDDGLAVHKVLVAAVICLFSIGLACVALRSRVMTNVPPAAKCFVSGLLSGLGLLVMLPSALEESHPAMSSEDVMRTFVAAPVLMFLIHHVLLGHEHGDLDGQHAGHLHIGAQLSTMDPCVCEKQATVTLSGLTRPTHCPPVNTPVKAEAPPTNCAVCAKQTPAVLLRAVPYTIHAFIDGAMLGTAHSATLLASLALAISLCAVQDVGTIILNLAATGASRRVTLITAWLFALGFPLGAAVSVALGPSAGADASTLVPLRAFAAGVFVYMSLFELAPPHAHGRLESLRFLCAFAVGMSLVFLSEAAESWAVGSFFDAEVSGATVSNVSSLLANNISRLVVTEEDVGVDRLVPLEASAPMAHAQAHAGE